MLDRTTTPVDELVGRINCAVAVCNDAEKKAEGAKAEFTSRGRAVGVLLLELKQRYPNKPKEFEAKLTEVSGLHRTRAYDYMALAGGRKTEAGLREEARLRKEKERERKAKEKQEREQAEEAKRKSVRQAAKEAGVDCETIMEARRQLSAGQPGAREIAEAAAARRKAESVTVTDEKANPKQDDRPVTKASALDEFRFAARNWIPKMSAVDKQKALKPVTELVNGRTAK